MLRLGLGISRSDASGSGGEPSGGHHMIMYMGNSASVGRDDNAGYSFVPNVQEYNQAGALAPAGTSYGNGGTIDAGDTNNNVDYYSPALAMTETYLSQNPSLDGIILVPQAQGGSNLGDEWSIPSGTETLEARARLDAAYTAASAAGITITKTLFVYMSLASDLSTNGLGTTFIGKMAQFEDYINYWFDAAQTADKAFAINTGPAQEWLDINSQGDDVDFISQIQTRRSWASRQANVGVVDFQSFPQTLIDTTGHASTDTNRLQVGPNLSAALSGAGARETTEFQGLSFFADLNGSYPQSVPLFDEVTETRRGTITSTDTSFYRETTASGKTFVGSSPFEDSRSSAVPMDKTSNWTIMWSGVVDSFGATFGVLQNIGINVRMYYSAGSGLWTFGTTGTAGTATVTASTGDLVTLCMSYDGTTCRFYENGVEVGLGIATANQTGVLVLGAQTEAAQGALSGSTQHVAVADRVLTATEIAEYHTVSTAP